VIEGRAKEKFARLSLFCVTAQQAQYNITTTTAGDTMRLYKDKNNHSLRRRSRKNRQLQKRFEEERKQQQDRAAKAQWLSIMAELVEDED